MKKNIITALLVLALVSVGVFAVDNAEFSVTTSVQGINKMKVTNAEFTSTAPGQFDSAVAFTELEVVEAGAQEFSAWLSTISNNRAGYAVTMSATAMKSTIPTLADSYINYTVGVNSKSITTTGATAANSVAVIEVASLTGLAVQSHQISLSVDQPTFDAAVEGSYIGTVTFEYTAN